MGPHDDIEGYIDTQPDPDADSADTENHGLRFTNDEWNGSIANGQSFTFEWNDTIKDHQGDVRLFRIWYPEDGVITFEPVSNLTDSMHGMACTWTPMNLTADDLYAVWVTKKDTPESQWAISPPWKIVEEQKGSGPLHWRNAVGIPIVVILGVYFLSLATCLLYRRRIRPRKKRDSNLPPPRVAHVAPPMPDDPDRHPSVSSVVTVQTLTEEDELIKSEEDGTTWIVTNPRPPPPASPGVAWNRVVWRRDGSVDSGDQPILTAHHAGQTNAWNNDGPIGQAR